MDLDGFENDLPKLISLDFAIVVFVTRANEIFDVNVVNFLCFVEFLEGICKHGHDLISIKEATVVFIVFGEDFFDYFGDLLFGEAHGVGRIC